MSDVNATQPTEAQQIEAAVEKVLESNPPAPHPSAAVVDAWFNKYFNDSVVSRNTEIFNYVRSAVIDLKTELAG